MSDEVTVQLKAWGGPALGFVYGTLKAVIQLGLALETFFYGAVGAAGVLFVQEVYRIIKDRIKQVKQKKKDGTLN